MRTLRAKFVAPMSAPLIENGVIVIRDDRVVAVGGLGEVETAGDVIDLGDVVLLPGLINAHTHLELSDASPGPRPASFGQWLIDVVTRRTSIPPAEFEAKIASAARRGAAESISFGVTTVGDISRECSITRPALRDGPLRVVSFGEVQALAQRRELLDPRLASAIDQRDASETLHIGLSPHAPYTIEPDGLRRCVEAARDHRLPICMHLAETLDEWTFLADHAGPLREVWDHLDAWDAAVPRWPAGPIDLARETGLLSIAPLLAHVNYANDAELDLLAAHHASVVVCPRTHDYFGHAPHRWREMLSRGINVCVGTDSRASSPDLNVVDDLRLLHRQSPDVDPATLWSLVTTRAACALKLDDVGSLRNGARADLVAFTVTSDDPLREILAGTARPSHVWINGAPQSASGL